MRGSRLRSPLLALRFPRPPAGREGEGEEGRIAFNNRYLQDVLQVLEKGKVALETTGPSNPGVFRPVERENYVHVIMPMFVQWT